jgi:hypothetical protein
MPKDSVLRKWSDFMLEAAEITRRPIDSAKSYKSQLETAGFISVKEVIYEWPQNPWPKEPKLKEMGMSIFLYCIVDLHFIAKIIIGFWNLENTTSGLEGFSMAPFTRTLGWTKQDVEVFSACVRNEMKDKRIHAYWPM